jgi:hypothetical protein
LTKIGLNGTGVTGDIANLKLLRNLTWINLNTTDVSGDIEHLKSLENLDRIWLGNLVVTGDIAHLKSLPKLSDIDFEFTDVYGDKIAFHEYRESEGLPECKLYL